MPWGTAKKISFKARCISTGTFTSKKMKVCRDEKTVEGTMGM